MTAKDTMAYRNRPARNTGHTIIELVVAVGIFSVLLFLINSLFQSTSAVVTRSMQTSKVIATTRALSEQISQDAEQMVGPRDPGQGPGGYLVIIQQRVNGVTMLDPETLTEVENNRIRADQMVFIRDAAGLRSTTPMDENSYGSNLVGQPGDVARVYYGHAQRTADNGGPAPAPLGDEDAGLDAIGSNWLLARQAMLYNPTNIVTGARLSDAAGGVTHAANAANGATVNNSGAGSPSQVFMGLTDVAIQKYYQPDDPDAFVSRIVDGDEATQNNLYRNTAFPNLNQRLHVNPKPIGSGSGFEAWAFAQTHPVLAQGCSDFIIDFAADLNGNGRIDREPGGGPDNEGAIYWYDALNGEWNPSAENWVQQTTPETIPRPLVIDGADTKTFVFRIEDDKPHDPSVAGTQEHSYWPYLIRIRYRLHDTRGRLISSHREQPISGRWFENIIKVKRP